MRFLPEDKRALMELALRITASLDTPEERKAVADAGLAMLADGKVTVVEWTQFGKQLGIYKRKK
tara:strand:- start:50 stop:241 length:192 start_codon:yes stop_codon:yes gene_type:complete